MNPFSLSFGKEPINAIRQDMQINEIVEGFTSENPAFQVCMITGVRGTGKTDIFVPGAEVSHDRMLRKGIMVNPVYGQLRFTLPRFERYVRSMTDYEY